jgi:5,10-methenyltetrahydrofolate synthetase
MADRDDVNPPASPPCSMDEFAEQLLPQTARASAAPRAPDWPLVRAFRAAERERLLAARRATALRERQRRAAAIDARIFASLDLTPFHTIGIYWPIKGEPDLRGVGRRHVLAGGSLALPVVVERGAPVEFWHWEPGQPTQPGFWNIPQPVERNVVAPDALLIPLVGFDAEAYRLGYGGGYYDRTLATFARKPFCIGVGDAEAEIASIRPQPHDIPMDVVVTDRALQFPPR